MGHHLLRTSDLRKTCSMPLHCHRSRHILLAHTSNLAKLVNRTSHKLRLRRIRKQRHNPRQLGNHLLD